MASGVLETARLSVGRLATLGAGLILLSVTMRPKHPKPTGEVTAPTAAADQDIRRQAQIERNQGGRADDGRGRDVNHPINFPRRGWWDILNRVWYDLSTNNMSIVAAGVAFYALFSIFPGLALLVSLYGLFADRKNVSDLLDMAAGVLPDEAQKLLSDQLQALLSAPPAGLGLAALIGLVLALWSARSSAGALISALNITYDEQEKRSFVRVNLVAIAFTLGAVSFAVIALTSVAILPVIIEFLPIGEKARTILSLVRWPLLAALVVVALTLLYRYGPCRHKARWRWTSPGAVVATLLWIAASALFSYYAGSFASYDKTYGSIGAVVVLLTWFYLTSYIVLLGAELNAEMEHQTAEDTTEGHPRPLGQRRATMADTIGRAAGR